MKTLFAGAGILALVLSTTTVWAIGPGKNRAIEGVVSHISNDRLIVRSQMSPPEASTTSLATSNLGEPEKVALQTNEQTQYTDIDSLNELKNGDQVKVEYTEDGHQNVATVISRLEADMGQRNFDRESTTSDMDGQIDNDLENNMDTEDLENNRIERQSRERRTSTTSNL